MEGRAVGTPLGERIRLARKEAGMTQKDLAGEEYSAAFVSQIERGVIRPSLQSLQVLAGRLRKPVGYFMESEADLQEKECDWLLASGHLLAGAGRAPRAAKAFQKAGQLAAEIGDRRREAEAVVGQARLHETHGNLAEAEKAYEKALAGFDEVSLREGRVTCLIGLAGLEEKRNRMAQALEKYQAALDAAMEDEPGDLGLRLRAVGRLGLAHYRFGDFSTGTRYHDQALDLLRPIRSPQDLVQRYLDAAQAHHDSGDMGRALAEAAKGKALLDTQADFVLAADLNFNAGLIAVDRGDWEEGAERFEASLNLYRRAGDRAGEASAIIEMARYHHHGGRPPKALAACEAAIELAGQLGDEVLAAQAQQILGQVYVEMKDDDRAIEALVEGARLFEKADRPADLADCCYELGELYMARGERDKALSSFQRATGLFRQLGLASGRGNMDDRVVKRLKRPSV